jgi:membrane protease YdiL (CAAX protease family)
MLVVAVLPAIFEELLFRGVLLQGLKGFPVWLAALICGGLFSLFHQNPAQTLYQFFCGVAFALLALRSGSILPTVVAHFCNNAFVLCAEKFSWQADMLPILIASAVCLLVSVGYLILYAVKAGRADEEKADWKGFLLSSSAGVVICVVGWVSGLFGG